MRNLLRQLPAALAAAAVASCAGSAALAQSPSYHSRGYETATASHISGRCPGTPKVDNPANANLLTNNPNDTHPLNGANAADPFRLDRTQAATADQNHGDTAEQEAYDGAKADLFPLYTGSGTAGGLGAFGTRDRSWATSTATSRP